MAEEKIVEIVMGSQSDWVVMKNAANILEQFDIDFAAKIISAHRTPERLYSYAKSAKGLGVKIIIAGAGGAAHLPGMVAALTPLPVLGVPINTKTISGMDSLLSIAQMPKGVPVGCVAIDGAANAALLAVRILASFDERIAKALNDWHQKQTSSVLEKPE